MHTRFALPHWKTQRLLFDRCNGRAQAQAFVWNTKSLNFNRNSNCIALWHFMRTTANTNRQFQGITRIQTACSIKILIIANQPKVLFLFCYPKTKEPLLLITGRCSFVQAHRKFELYNWMPPLLSRLFLALSLSLALSNLLRMIRIHLSCSTLTSCINSWIRLWWTWISIQNEINRGARVMGFTTIISIN